MYPNAKSVFRDFNIDGVLSSLAHSVDKSEARAWGTLLESLLGSTVVSNLIYPTRTALYADLVPVEPALGLVGGDPTPGYDGLYRKVGATGLGSWTQVTDYIPGAQLVTAVNAGAGTANAIIATSTVAIGTANQIIITNLVVTNTTAAVTIRFNGGTIYNVKTAAGVDPAIGSLPARIVGTISGANFLLLSDTVSNAFLNSALAAAAASAASAAAAAASVISAQNASLVAGYFPNAQANLPRGIVGTSGLAAGSGGTNGTAFALSFSGGNFAINPTGTFVVAGGIVTSVTITGPGLYVGASPTAPTASFAASAGLTGASVTLTVDYKVLAGGYYWTEHPTDTNLLALYFRSGTTATISSPLVTVPKTPVIYNEPAKARSVLLNETSAIGLFFAETNPWCLVKDPTGTKKLSGLASSILSVTNAGVTYGFNKFGLLTAFGANTPKYDYDQATYQPKGILSEGARTQSLLHNRVLSITHQMPVTGGAGTFVDGETVNATGGGTGKYHLGESDTTRYAIETGTGTFTGTLTGATSGATKTITSVALVWVATNANVVRDQIGIDGITNSACSITATAPNATVNQALTRGSAATNVSLYIKRLVGTGPVYLSMDGGVTYPPQEDGPYVPTPLVFDNNISRVFIQDQTLANPNVMIKVATTGDGVMVDCTHCESSSKNYPTSPIPTTTLAITRASDNIKIAKSLIPSDFVNYTVYIEFMTYGKNATRGVMSFDNDGSNVTDDRIFLQDFYLTASNYGNAQMNLGAVSQANMSVGDISSNALHRAAISFTGSTRMQLCWDGALANPDTSYTPPSTTYWRLGNSFNSPSNNLDGWIQLAIITNRTMSDTELQDITTSGFNGSLKAITITPDNATLSYEDFTGTLTKTTTATSNVRTIVQTTYENTNPGGRLRFKTKAQNLLVHLDNPLLSPTTAPTNALAGPYAGSVYADGVWLKDFGMPSINSNRAIPLDFLTRKDREIDVLLPPTMSARYLGLSLPFGEVITAPSSRSALPLCVFAGDSRIHGNNVSAARYHWVELLCRLKGWRSANIGYGQRRLNANTADGTVAGNLTPAVAICMYDQNDRADQVATATHQANVTSWISNFRALRPTTKIWWIGSNWISAANDTLTLKIADYRAAEVAAIAAIGSANTNYIDGLTLTANSTLSIGDGVHPNDFGSAEWATNLAPLVSV